jgi:hypothetical protein
MPIANGNCTGAAAATTGGTLDASLTMALALHDGGQYGLCLAEVPQGVSGWILPGTTNGTTRRRGQALDPETPQLVTDDDFAWYGHITCLVAPAPAPPPSAPFGVPLTVATQQGIIGGNSNNGVNIGIIAGVC